MTTTIHNGILFVPQNTLDPAAGLNEALFTVDTLLQTEVLSIGSNTPPGSPADGNRHIVGPSPTGAWAGQAGKIAQWVAAPGYWIFAVCRFVTLAGVVWIRNGSTWEQSKFLPTKTPASASATGTAGEVAWDASYVYICTATNTWKRVAITTW